MTDQHPDDPTPSEQDLTDMSSNPQVPTGPHELELEILELRPALEAVLMVADQPLDHLTLAQAVGHPPAEVERTLSELSAEYADQGRGFDLRAVAGGWRFFSRADFAPAVERFILEGQQARLTQAALETVAVVAYRQPISRSRISAIRGVNVDGVVRTLVTRGLIEEQGTDAESGALLYRTTSYFLERMGLGSIDELPALAPLLPEVDDPDAYGTDDLDLPVAAPVEDLAEDDSLQPTTRDDESGDDA